VSDSVGIRNIKQEDDVDRGRGRYLDGNMPKTTQGKRTKQSVEAQLALAERVLKGVNRTIDEQIQRAQDLEVEHALTLYKCGKATLLDGKEVIKQATRLVG
jgi:hypothetical protein